MILNALHARHKRHLTKTNSIRQKNMENNNLTMAQTVDMQELFCILSELGYKLVKLPTSPDFDSFLRVVAGRAQHKAEMARLESDVNNPRLVVELKKWRREQARVENVPPYYIFNDRTLLHIAVHEPATFEEFQAVPGVGEVKAGKYCRQILKLIERVNNGIQ